MGDSSGGHYATLSIVDWEGTAQEKHYGREFHPGNPAAKRPNDEAWCAAKWGDKYGVKVVSLQAETYIYKVFIDGTLMRSFYMPGGDTSTLKEVCTRTIGYGPTTRKVYQPLVFAQPDLKGEDGEEADERPLNQQLAGAGIDKLGRITLEIWDAVRTEPKMVTGVVVDNHRSEKMNEKALIKKGAFASTTKFGGEERVAVNDNGISLYSTGYNKLETLELRYGHVSQLLILGCPAAKFRVRQNAGDVETVELSDDEEEEEEEEAAKRRKRAAVKKEQKEGANKRVKPEPGTAAAASSSAAAAAGPGDDGVWDLT